MTRSTQRRRPFGFPRLRGPVVAALGAAVIFLSVAPASGQSAQDIISQALEASERRMAGVENLTMRQEVMGVSTTTYMVKEMVEGYPVLRAESVDAMGVDMDMMEDSWDVWADPRSMYGATMDAWTLEGAGNVDGRSTWRLILTDVDLLDWGEEADWEDDAVFEAERVILDMDQERLVPLRMELEGELMGDGGARPVGMVMTFSDYRTVEGYLHPFLTVVEMDMGAAGLSAEEITEAREAMAEFQRELERVPAAQREMMEQMMGDQMEMFEQVLAGEGIKVELRVTELLVNRGPPGGG